MKVDRMERPYVYLEGDEIKMLSFGIKKEMILLSCFSV